MIGRRLMLAGGVLAVAGTARARGAARTLDIRAFGAIGDGVTLATQAL